MSSMLFPFFTAEEKRQFHGSAVRHGFTLLELLVTISIMLLLASLLGATISSVRQMANRVRCASTLRQVYSGFLQFSLENKGQVPLVYLGDAKQDNYYYYDDRNHGIGSPPAGAFGILFVQGYVDPQRGWYCSANRNPKWSFQTKQNAWPPRNGIKTRGNYGARPEVTETASIFPRLSEYNQKAIVSDICSESVQLLDHHRTGMNVAYGDGAIRYQRAALFSAPYRHIPNGLGYAAAYNNSFKNVWQLLDTL